jgi:hypothetical protein
VQTRENKDDKKSRATISLVMSAILIVGLISAGVVTMLAAQTSDRPNVKTQDRESNSFEESAFVVVVGNSGSNTSDKRRQITLVAQDAEIEMAPGKQVIGT